jgi:hypothetical protein
MLFKLLYVNSGIVLILRPDEKRGCFPPTWGMRFAPVAWLEGQLRRADTVLGRVDGDDFLPGESSFFHWKAIPFLGAI